jgi:RNA polymerase sigma factor (TIGR02999 family)
MIAGADDVTGLLRAWNRGDAAALDRLIPLVERELNQIARRCLGGERANSVSATALVNEAYLRLVDVHHVEFNDRAHFLAMSARVMRRVLIDLARARRSDKRGAALRVTLDVELVADRGRDADLMALDEALEALAAIDARKSQVVELKFFGGLSADETAAALGVSSKTVKRDWAFARAWLQREMTNARRNDP